MNRRQLFSSCYCQWSDHRMIGAVLDGRMAFSGPVLCRSADSTWIIRVMIPWSWTANGLLFPAALLDSEIRCRTSQASKITVTVKGPGI
jgi:hypothetical protein